MRHSHRQHFEEEDVDTATPSRLQLIGASRSFVGACRWRFDRLAKHARLQFSVMPTSMIEITQLAHAVEACERMMRADARQRMCSVQGRARRAKGSSRRKLV